VRMSPVSSGSGEFEEYGSTTKDRQTAYGALNAPGRRAVDTQTPALQLQLQFVLQPSYIRY